MYQQFVCSQEVRAEDGSFDLSKEQVSSEDVTSQVKSRVRLKVLMGEPLAARRLGESSGGGAEGVLGPTGRTETLVPV